jgi:lipoate-protein ligase A
MHDAERWRQWPWQVIHDTPRPPLLQMALDEALLAAVAAGHRPALLRLWEWSAPAVVIGRFQSLRNEVDAAAAARHGIAVVRRITGGGAMFIEPGNTITYSLIAPDRLVRGMSAGESYAFLDAWVLAALAGLGVTAWYQPINDITSAAGKIGGAAQTRRAGAVLHHVTMAYDIDAARMLEVLRIGREKLSDKGTASAVRRVDPLRRQTGLTRGQVMAQLAAGFVGTTGATPATLGPADIAAAEALVASKFATPEWLATLP